MSYSFRNRPKLSDRYRGKSGDEILNELKNQIDEDRKMFFESSPGWNSVQSPGSFSRAGHPLDDMMSRGRQDIRSHLDDLAQRHPEFADHLRCPPWGGEMGATSRGTWGRKRRGSGSSGDENPVCQETPAKDSELSEEPSPSRGRSRQNNLPQYGLRNTVDLGQQQQCEDQEKGRGQRSWSAPPDNRTQNPPDPPRFVSRLDIPINSMPSNTNPDQGKPPVAPKQQHHNVQQQHQPPPQQQSQQSSKQHQQGSTVRHIPIFVEGRDEPLLPKAADAPTEKIFTERVPTQTTFNYGRPSQFMARPGQQQSTPHMPQQSSYTQSTASPKPKTFAQQQQQVPPPPQSPPPSQQKQEGGPQQDQGQPKPTPQQPKQANDPISCVEAVQRDVDELKIKVNNYKGNSRKDKDYMYLDEMLTRNLLKLDNIETDGKDDVRQARKAVIRNIQQCISLLESKVPNSDDISQNSAVEIEKSPNNSSEELGLIDSVDQNSKQPSECAANNADSCTAHEKQNVSKNECELKMDAENSSDEVNQANLAVKVTNLSTDLVMDTDLAGNTNNVNLEQLSSNMESKEAKEGAVSDSSEINTSNVPKEQKNGINQEESTISNLQTTEMQAKETGVKDEASQEKMEIEDSACKKHSEVTTSSDANDEKSASQIPKCEVGASVSSKTSSKSKSPKVSPKKGKRAT